MKKILLFLSLIPTLLFTSCESQKIDKSKIALDYGYIRENRVHYQDFKELDYDELDALVTSKQTKSNFVLITFHSRSCGCLTDFLPILEEFANEYHVEFYLFDVGLFEKGKDKFGIYSAAGEMPGICFFRRGKLIRQTIYGKTNENSRGMFENYGKFVTYMLNNVYLPKMYYLDKSLLDEKISNNEEFNLYIARTGCPDCAKVDEKVLKKWSTSVAKQESVEHLYIFDLAPYYGKEEYQSIKDYYGLSETGNETFGYSTGMVPTFQRRKGLEVKDMITVLNDHLVNFDGIFTVSSYFTEQRISSSPILKDTGTKYLFDGYQPTNEQIDTVIYEGQTYYVLKDGVQLQWHTPIVNLYLETYVK